LIADLGLNNIEVIQSRVEDYHPKSCYDDVVSRAFTQLNELISLTRHLCCQNGRIWAMKGIYPDKEIAELPAGTPVEVIPLQIPRVQQQRHLVRLMG
jgi:16S rRNA (guanine527-N7)-methyltransferase